MRVIDIKLSNTDFDHTYLMTKKYATRGYYINIIWLISLSTILYFNIRLLLSKIDFNNIILSSYLQIISILILGIALFLNASKTQTAWLAYKLVQDEELSKRCIRHDIKQDLDTIWQYRFNNDMMIIDNILWVNNTFKHFNLIHFSEDINFAENIPVMLIQRTDDDSCFDVVEVNNTDEVKNVYR